MVRLAWALLVLGVLAAAVTAWGAPPWGTALAGVVAADAMPSHDCVAPDGVPCPPDPCRCDGLCGAALSILPDADLAFDAGAYFAAQQSDRLAAGLITPHGPPRFRL
ncbi:MAG: hypothetical protein FJX56_01565 [Alphaproteobacteria bacterium]|nr:hypothetical protein [Alphaproteobacteria bacterium]